jgi:hypothetical protein
MNKLLQRLPDSSREEVRNQAIVLIQQLTSTNEEMKKTVVFNEVRGTMSYQRAWLVHTNRPACPLST